MNGVDYRTKYICLDSICQLNYRPPCIFLCIVYTLCSIKAYLEKIERWGRKKGHNYKNGYTVSLTWLIGHVRDSERNRYKVLIVTSFVWLSLKVKVKVQISLPCSYVTLKRVIKELEYGISLMFVSYVYV